MMKYFLVLIFNLAFLYLFSNDYLLSYEKINSLSADKNIGYLNYFGFSTSGKTIYAVDVYKLTYVTTDVHGKPTVASGAVYIPKVTSCDFLPLVSWQHGTIFDKTEVASQNKGNAIIGDLISACGYIVTYPDYLGLGDNAGIHPYHHGDSEATAVMDLIRATREFLKESSGIKDNNQLFIAGYSQGGHATMAMHKFIQDHNLYSEFNIVASAPMSGAYDMVGAQFDLIFDGDSSYYMSSFIPYLMGSYQLVYENIYSSYSQIYDSPYDEKIKEYLEGNFTWQQWSSLVPPNYYSFMQDSVINNMVADSTRSSHPILKAMKKNSYIDWIPERSVKMLYSGKDSMVSPQNAINTCEHMLALGAKNIEAINVFPEGVHENSLIPELKYAMTWFEGIKTPCQLVTSSNDFAQKKAFSIFPNPSKNVININYPEELNIEIFSMQGQKVLSGKIAANGSIDISGLKPGQYIIVGKSFNSNNYLTSQFIAL